MIDRLVQDTRYAIRQLWRSPAFTIAALATLALGIGANTALFTIMKAILARPLPGVVQSDRLVWVTAARARGGQPTNMSYPDFVDYRAGLGNLVDMAAISGTQFSLSSRGEPERVRGEIVSGNYFSVLRTPFALGRGFAPSEDCLGNPRNVVVMSHALWQRRFDGDSSVIGQTVVVNGQPLTVVGVTARGFNGAELELPLELWVPLAQYNTANRFVGIVNRRNTWWLKAIARLKPGVRREEVEAASRTIAARIVKADSVGHEGISARVYSAKSGLPAGSEREVYPVAILASVVTGLVLLIACANVSNLLLSRAVTRRREIGIRLSLGASRMRLVSQLFTESLLLAVGAGAAGLLLAYWGTDFLVTSGIFPIPLDMTPDSGIIAFTVSAAAVAAVLFGLLPAFEATRNDIARAVKDGNLGRDPRRTRLQNSFVVTQLSLSLVLLTTAGLFLRSMYKASHVDIGFEATTRVLALSFDLGLQQYSDERSNAFLAELGERTRGMPGVQMVSFTDLAPLGTRYIATEISAEGQARGSRSADRTAVPRDVFQSTVRPGYFSTLGITLVRGRDFTTRDDPTAAPVIIVSDRTARALWPNQDPIGKRVSVRGDDGPYVTVVGVASDVMLGGPTEAKRATVYLPQLQYPGTKELTILVRTSGEPGPLAEALRREIRRMDPNLPVFGVHTMAEYKQLKLADRMNGATILGGFGGLALLLASIGVYGVMAFSVIQRTKEIGIRVALGARRRDVISLFVGRGMRLTVIGVVIGMTLSFAVSRLLQGMLFGLTPTDGATFLGVAMLLAGVALLACWVPARRAARVDPMQALRYE
jgi:predicted permease